MKIIINLPHRQSFMTENDEAAKAIDRVVNFVPNITGTGFTTSDYNELSPEAKEVFDRFKSFNDLLVAPNGVILMKLTVCDSIGLTDPSMLHLSDGWSAFSERELEMCEEMVMALEGAE